LEYTLDFDKSRRRIGGLVTAASAIALGVCLVLVSSLQNPARAQDNYPNRAVRLIVPFAPGGSTDVLARVYAARLGELLGQSIVVENRGGGASLVGIRAAAQSAPDGHTLLFAGNTLPLSLQLYADPGYRYEEFVPVAPTGQFPYVLLVHESIPSKTLASFVAYGKANPGKLNYMALGRGSGAALLTTRLFANTGITAVAVAYAGAGPAFKDVMSGLVPVAMAGATQIKNITPSINVVATATEQRLPSAPEVPTFRELGFPEMLGGAWYGIFAPVKTPAPIVQRLGRDIATASRDVKERLANIGVEPIAVGGPEEFRAFIEKDTARWAADIRRNNILPE
jgi:tripartite-type tricarboxylate transporter receptor subunit TctC